MTSTHNAERGRGGTTQPSAAARARPQQLTAEPGTAPWASDRLGFLICVMWPWGVTKSPFLVGGWLYGRENKSLEFE